MSRWQGPGRLARLLPTGLTRVGFGMLGALGAVAVCAPLLAPYQPRALVAAPLLAPSAAHLLGTNSVGQDLFSQLVYGTRVTMSVAPVTAALTVVLGTVVGLASALAGRTMGGLVVRFTDAFLALPKLPLLLILAVTAGTGLLSVTVSMVLLLWPVTARIVRAQTLSLRSRGFVSAARGFGAGPAYVGRRHVTPALAPVLLADFVTLASIAAVLEAGLAFLGLSDPLRTSWGVMLNDAADYPGVFFAHVWLWSLVPPALALTVAVLGFTFLGLGLEPLLQPRLQQHVP